MQLTSSYANRDYLKEYAPNIQAFAPMIENLSEQERFSLIKMIENISFSQQENNKKSKKLSPLDRQYLKGAVMSDDFDDYLGDDFWFPEDDILYK